ncbi:uncharacterized protein LOC124678853 isoform X3 [Lolium rigidum]|uniref:uncharacterized protein LOC124678853 isoform X3 n=1 Tax=Lolium rigidum TaxID=89674 RepID=UPI001F5C1925|nr:uncharacterized protein LOC124678853 isoform X3 [Lolium rigidum]
MEALQRRGSNHRWRLRVSQISTACGGGCPQPKLGIHVSDLTVSSSSSDIVRICYFRETLCKCRSNSFADSAGFVLFFDVVAGPSPAIGELLVMCAGQDCQRVTGAGKETAWNDLFAGLLYYFVC